MDENKIDLYDFMSMVNDILDDFESLKEMEQRYNKMMGAINNQYNLKYNFNKDVMGMK